MHYSTDTIWFDIALVTTLTAVGQIVFGHFEEHTENWRKLTKLAFFIGLVTAISSTAGQVYAWGFLAVLLALVFVIHGVILPRNGINGLTAEPREAYYKYRGWEKHL